MPKGVILGYYGEALFTGMDAVLDEINEAIDKNPNISDAGICQKWREANERYAKFNQQVSTHRCAYIRPSRNKGKSFYYQGEAIQHDQGTWMLSSTVNETEF